MAVAELSGHACGKLILLGEHAVVYGAPALVMGIDQQLEATVVQQIQGDAPCRLTMLGEEYEARPTGERPTEQALLALLTVLDAPCGLTLELSGGLPPGVGLGFSACAGVALARAVMASTKRDEEGLIREAAMAWEAVFHGNPSGVDVDAAIYGGCLRFTKSDGSVPVAVSTPLSFCVGLTGQKSSTRTMVEGVEQLRERNPELVRRSVDGIAALVENAIGTIEDGKIVELGELMNLNQMLLAGLMVSTVEIEQLCDAARDVGAHGAKLTGAGGGGAVVALTGRVGEAADLLGEKVLSAWKRLGYSGFKIATSTKKGQAI